MVILAIKGCLPDLPKPDSPKLGLGLGLGFRRIGTEPPIKAQK